MAERSMLDPFGLWAELAAIVEKVGNEAGQRGMKSAEFSALMNKALAGSITARKAIHEAMRRYLEVMNLPSRDDITALGEQLRAVEDRLVDMSAVLERLDPNGGAGGRAAPPIPPRTRKPPPEASSDSPAASAPAAVPAATPAGAPTSPTQATPRKAARRMPGKSAAPAQTSRARRT